MSVEVLLNVKSYKTIFYAKKNEINNKIERAQTGSIRRYLHLMNLTILVNILTIMVTIQTNLVTILNITETIWDQTGPTGTIQDHMGK